MKAISFKILAILTPLIIVVTACGNVRGPEYKDDGSPVEPPTPGITLFPHSVGWGDSSGHGQYVVDNGFAGCGNGCHGVPNDSAAARGCKSCHEYFPHDEAASWLTLAGHGKFVRDVGGAANCKGACHGEDLLGGHDPNNKKSCVKCHKSFPFEHDSPAWESPGHGKYVIQAGNSTECTTMCHRTNIPVELRITGCLDCHESYPDLHNKFTWANSGHKDFIRTLGGLETAGCTACHGGDLKGGTSKVACASSSCHHPQSTQNSAWENPGEHGAKAMDNLSNCQTCHEKNLKGNSLVVGCDSCHHKKWEEKQGAPWKKGSEHGSFGAGDANSCKLCHGADLSGGISEVACSVCHGTIYPHNDNWKDKWQHGLAAKGDIDKCVSCHIDETKNDCKTCHHKNDALWFGGHGAKAHVSVSACKVCHGEDLKSGAKAKVEGVLVDVAPGCVSVDGCHGASLHKADYANKANHAPDASADISNCKTCHGYDFNGGFVGKNCFDCHDVADVYPHTAGWETQGQHGATYLSFKKNNNKKDACNNACHGKDMLGGFTKIACNKCHKEFPHNFNNGDNFHGKKVLTATDDFDIEKYRDGCEGCHGELTPLTDKWEIEGFTKEGVYRCQVCHWPYPHYEYDNVKTGVIAKWGDEASHIYYLLNNDNFGGNEVLAVKNSCEGVSSGRCHTGTRHKMEYKYVTPACNALCHGEKK